MLHLQMAAFVAGFVEHARVMEVIKDSFGNYVAQRLIEHADGASRLAIGRFLAPAVLDLSKHQYGCRVVQSAIQVSNALIPSPACPCLGSCPGTLSKAQAEQIAL